MINFIDEKGVKHSAVVECKKTKGVNGEKSLSGTIYTNNEILEGIGRGWRLEFENEKYCLTYVYPIDEGNRIVVEFDAVHEFFFDLNKKVVYTELNGSNTAKAYLDIIFNGSGYSYLIEVNIPAFEKEGFGMRNRLDLFKEFVSDTGVEFSVNGKVVRILEKVGSNLSTIVKKGFNLNELRIEKDPSSFITYKKGFGAWVDEDDHSKGRLEVEYLSPLASIYGKLEGDPIVDERYKVASNFETRLKNDVESSYGISVDIDMEDLTKAGYEYEQPHEGDYIMAINKDLGFEQKIRIMSYETSYDTNGNIIDHKVSCGSDNIIRKSIKEDDDFRKEIQAGLEGAISTSNKAWVSANGKNAVFEGPNEPTATAIGDIWWQIDGEEKKMRIWNGYEWKPVFNPGEIENKIDQAEKNIAQNIVDIESALDKATQAELDAGFSKDLAGEAKALGVTASSLAGEAATNANKAMTDAQEAIRQVVLNGGVAADASAEATEARRLAGLAEGNAQEALTKANTSVTDASKALTDATKAFNKSFKSSAIAYATSTNGSTPPTTGWLSTVPTPSPDVYIWTRTTILLNDNTPVVSYSVGKIGAKGDQGLKGDTGAQGTQGAPGTNAPTITSVVQQFYLSTSKTTQTGGSWLSTVPVWSSGRYYWVRVATTYSNGSTTTSTPVLDNALNDSLVTALEVKTANQNLSTTVTQHATLIESKANSTTVDAIAGRVSTAEGSISTIAGQVALKASTTDLNTLTGRVTTAEGTITAQAGQIALKASQTSVDTLTGRVGTAEASITANSTAINLRATKTELTTAIDGIQVGGRNYWAIAKQPWYAYLTHQGYGLFTNNATASSFAIFSMRKLEVPVGEIYTVSFEINVSDDAIQFQHALFYVNGESPSSTHNKPTLVKDKWIKVYTTINYTVENNAPVHIYIRNISASGAFQIRNFKLEKGNKATDWTPAPEDVNASIATVQSDLTVEAGKITALTTKTNGHTTQIGQLQTSYSGLSSTVSALETGKVGNTAFSALEQNLNGFKTTVANTYADKTTVTQLSTQWTTTTNLVNGHTSQITSMGTAINLRATKTEVDEKILTDKKIKDTRSTNQLPPWYYTNYPSQQAYEFKQCTTIGLPGSAGTYASVVTEVPWSSSSGGSVEQTATAKDGVYKRRGTTTWSAWAKVADSSNIVSQINISPESILIASKKIQIKGDTYIDNGVIKTAHIADLAVSGAKIANASIASAKIISLDASKITVGTLTGFTLSGSYINGGRITSSGAIGELAINGASLTINNDKIIGGKIQRAIVALSNEQQDFPGLRIWHGVVNSSGIATESFGSTNITPENGITTSKPLTVGNVIITGGTNIKNLENNMLYIVDQNDNRSNLGLRYLNASSHIQAGNTIIRGNDIINATNGTINFRGNEGQPMNIHCKTMQTGNLMVSENSVFYSLNGSTLYFADRSDQRIDIAVRTVGQSSKYELKENFAPISEKEAMDAIIETDVVRYNFKGDNEPHLGLIIDDAHRGYAVNDMFVSADRSSKKDSDIIGALMLSVKYLNSNAQISKRQIKELVTLVNISTSNVIELVANDSIYSLRLNNLESEVFRLKKRIEELEKIA